MAAAAIPNPRDEGLQPERTALAWNRTGLAVAVNALLCVRAGISGAEPSLTAIGALLFAAAGVAVVYGSLRKRQLRGDTLVATPPPAVMLAVAAITLIAAGAGIASILVEG